jgi:hypothetical protein
MIKLGVAQSGKEILFLYLRKGYWCLSILNIMSIVEDIL